MLRCWTPQLHKKKWQLLGNESLVVGFTTQEKHPRSSSIHRFFAANSLGKHSCSMGPATWEKSCAGLKLEILKSRFSWLKYIKKWGNQIWDGKSLIKFLKWSLPDLPDIPKHWSINYSSLVYAWTLIKEQLSTGYGSCIQGIFREQYQRQMFELLGLFIWKIHRW